LELNEELEFEKDMGCSRNNSFGWKSSSDAQDSEQYRGRYEKWLINKIRSDECRTRRWHTDVPHFEYGIAYPAQQPLTIRSTFNNFFGEHRDNVYHETLGLPEVYPQEDLCDESDVAEEEIVETPQDGLRILLAENSPPDLVNLGEYIPDNEFRPQASTKEAHALAQRSSFTQTQADATDAGLLIVDDALGAIKSVQQEPVLSIELTKSMFQNQLLDDAQQAFFSRVPHAQAFGQVKTIDLPIIEKKDIVQWFMKEVDSTRHCALCAMVSFGLTSVESADEEGWSSQRVQGPTIITDSNSEEVVSLLPNFNRMMLNRQEGSCSQCSLVMEVLLLVHGLAIFDEHSFFDREALIQCYLSPPIGSVEQYVNLLSEEICKPSPRPIPAPQLVIKAPHKRREASFAGWGNIPLLVHNTSLPLPGIQGSGRCIKSDSVDQIQLKKWWNLCQKTHDQRCQTPLKLGYPGYKMAGYSLRLVDVERNRVIVSPPGSRYVALSYVWPKTDNAFRAQKHHFQRSQSTTVEDHIRDDQSAYFDVPIERLPKTIQDALHITRAIGERYLWVDALCIIQDDIVDVQRTVYRMDQVYKAASLTIIMGDQEGAALEGGRLDHTIQSV
jgi:hypothetical protein